MSDEPDSLVLRMLRRMDEKLDRIRDDIADLKPPVTALEGNLAIVISGQASHSARLDRLDDWLGRIERRIDLVAAP